jgi:transcriptional regulator with XRE-family HTH domain
MTDQIRQIADRIRGLREGSDISLETFAKDLSLPADKYAEYESGEVDIPVGLLHQIAVKLDVELTALLTGEDPRLRHFCVVRADKGVVLDRRKEYEYQSLAANFVHKKAEPLLVTVEPQDAQAPLPIYAHPGQEFNYVLEGRMMIVIAGHEVTLDTGDSVYFDASVEHGMKALDDKTARFLAVIV